MPKAKIDIFFKTLAENRQKKHIIGKENKKGFSVPQKKIIIGVLFSAVLASLYAKVTVAVDFGIQGHTESVDEKSFQKKFETAFKDMNMTAKFEDFKASIPRVADSHINLHECDENITRYYSPGITLTKNYYFPDGSIAAKKGQRINPLDNLPDGIPMSRIVMLDGTKKQQINYVKHLCPAGKCTVFITSGNSFDIEKKYGLHTDPIPLPYLQVFDTKCTLSIIDAVNKNFKIKEISLKEEDNASKKNK